MALQASKLRNMGAHELDNEEGEIRDAIWKLQLQRSTGQIQDPNKLRGLRKDLARVLTVRRAQELAAGSGEGR
jgi:large subunit ribosomal protein L29